MAAGLLVGASLATALLFSPRYIRVLHKDAAARICIGILLFLSYVSVLYVITESAKVLTSLLLPPLLLYAYIFSRRLTEMRPKDISTVLGCFLFITLMLGWLAVFDLSQLGDYSRHLKAVAPFAEESHYALCVGTFAILYSLVSRGSVRLIVLVNVLVQSLAFPSLTLLVFSAILSGLFLMQSGRWIKLIVAVPTSVALSLALYGVLLENEYFASRLTVFGSSNLTTLVWVQGWELAKLNSLSNFGMGLGLQMLGGESTRIPHVSHVIQGMHAEGRILNLEDGGFLAAKLSAELGAIGVIIVFAYALALVRALAALNKKRGAESGYFLLLFHGATLSLLVEFFLRGYGYFSPGLLLFVALMLAMRREKLVTMSARVRGVT